MSPSAARNSAKPGRRPGQSRRTRARKQLYPAIFNAKKVARLRATFARIEAQGAIAGLVFYQKLFTLEPSLRSLFRTSIDLQTRKLMDSLSYTVGALENPRALVPVLEAMGRRHVAYGVREEHYDVVNRALLETFEQILGDVFSDEIHETWLEALSFVAKTMKHGARAAVPKVGTEHKSQI